MNRHILDTNLDITFDIKNNIPKYKIKKTLRYNGFDSIHHKIRFCPNFPKLLDNAFNIYKPQLDKKDNIIIINRSYTEPKVFMNETYGSQRRSIKNINEIYDAVRNKYPNTELLELENMSIKEQIEKFYGAKLIIAQHGASLANLVWCREKTNFIEISSYDLGNIYMFYGVLSEKKNLTRTVIREHGLHLTIDPNKILDLLPSL
jgi:hypothetical protein